MTRSEIEQTLAKYMEYTYSEEETFWPSTEFVYRDKLGYNTEWNPVEDFDDLLRVFRKMLKNEHLMGFINRHNLNFASLLYGPNELSLLLANYLKYEKLV